MVGKSTKKKTPVKNSERVLRALLFLKEVARRPGEPITHENKTDIQVIQKLRKAMFIKPEKRMTSHQRTDYFTPDSSYKCEKCGCRSTDTIICPWLRQKMYTGGVDVHSYPHPMSEIHKELERRLQVVSQNYFNSATPATVGNEMDPSLLKKSRLLVEQDNQDIIILNKWSPYEIAVFEAGIAVFGKRFDRIAKILPSKTTKEIIAFYSLWHFSSHYCMWKNQRSQPYLVC